MDQPNPTFAKISILDTGKFKQWKFKIQQYLQNEHYALWEVIKFGDSYKAPPEETGKGPASESSTKKKGRIVVITIEDMQKRRNDVKARTTLLLSLPDEHQLRFSKYETAQEAEGSETLEQTFNRLQAIVSHLEFMDVDIKQDDLNQKFLTSLAPEWLMYTIVWRNKDDLDTISLDDVYNHLNVYEPEVQKNSQIKYEDITQINEDDIEEIDIKWNITLLSMRADRFWKKTGKKITIQGSDVAGFDKSKSYMANKEENHALVADDEVPTEFALIAKLSSGSEKEVEARIVEFKEQEIKLCEKIRGLKRDVEVRNNKIKYLENELEQVKKEKEGLDNKLTGFEKASKDLDNLLGSQRSDKNKEGLGYSVVPPPPPAQVYSPPKKDLSWTCLPEFVDDTVTDYSIPTPNSIMSKPMIKFVKVAECPRVIKTNKTETARKSPVKYAEKYRNTLKSPKVRGNQRGGKITGKGIIKTGKLEFENVYFVKELKYNLLSVSQIYDNKNSVLFTDSECIVLGKDFKLKDDTDVLLKTPRQYNVYSINLKNIVPHKNLTCLVEKASVDKSMLWHRRLGHLNFKTMNKLVRNNLVRGLPSKCFENDHTCVACLKGKQHKASCKTKSVNSISKLLHTLHMDLFRPTFVSTLTHKWYCLVVTDDFSSKAFRVFNKRTKKVEENLHVDFFKNKLIEKGADPNWLFDIDTLTNSINYVPVVVAGTSSTNISAHMETKNSNGCNADDPESCGISNPTTTLKIPSAEQVEPAVSLKVETKIPTVNSPVPTVCLDTSPGSSSDPRIISKGVFSHVETSSLGNALTLSNRIEDTFGEEVDLSNMETSIPVSPTSTFRIHKDHPKSQIIGPVDTPVQTRHKSKEMEEQCFIATIHHKTNPELLQFCLFSCFLSQEEPKKIFDALKDPSWVEAMQEELLQFKIQNVWILVDCPKGEEGIDYEEVFAPVTRIEAIRLFLAYASFMGFIVYQMDVKSAFIYGTINEEIYVMQPPGFQDPEFPDRVYKVENTMYGLHQAPRAWYGTLSKSLLDNGFQRVLQKKDGIFLSQDKYVGDILRKFGYSDVRPDIMFVVCACAKHQVTAKECHLHAVKRIFRYLKGHPKLGLWYPKAYPFDFVAYSDSDYGGATQDRKLTTEGCQFLRRRLISWQCKKQTIVATSTTKAEYVAAASGYG
nr:hypothetical protein [Tanacetum cinerariifolium]